MTTLHKQPRWYIGFYPPFRESYKNLKPEHQWRIKHSLNNLRYLRDPVSYYASAQCPTLQIPNNKDYNLLNVSLDGNRTPRVEVLIKIDRTLHVIYPIFCREKND